MTAYDLMVHVMADNRTGKRKTGRLLIRESVHLHRAIGPFRAPGLRFAATPPPTWSAAGDGATFSEFRAIAVAGRSRATVRVANTGDRPIQVGSHAHFFEVNEALAFDRETAYGMFLDISPGTAIRFEPGIERPVDLVAVGGQKRNAGLRGKGR
jgi:urease beta subunit